MKGIKIMKMINGMKKVNTMKITNEINGRNKRFRLNNKGMGTVEIILIIVVLIGLVIIFRSQIRELVEVVFDKISADSSTIMA